MMVGSSSAYCAQANISVSGWRSIVDQQHLEILKGLRPQRIERLLQVRFAIIIHDDDRNGDHMRVFW